MPLYSKIITCLREQDWSIREILASLICRYCYGQSHILSQKGKRGYQMHIKCHELIIRKGTIKRRSAVSPLRECSQLTLLLPVYLVTRKSCRLSIEKIGKSLATQVIEKVVVGVVVFACSDWLMVSLSYTG